jgi:DNA-binding response OmpR family regulator
MLAIPGMEQPLRILAVDNEPSVTLALRYIFEEPRYEIVTVGDGDTALARLHSDPVPFHVIIVDQKMPHLSGLDLVREIRKRHVQAQIIVVSAHLSTEVRQAYDQLNVRTMFSKPFSVALLRKAVDRLAA